jgi:DNA primase
MVEGYTDVIAMHQAGIENVVANSGTALSVHQIHLLHRFTNNITLLYDGDEAGIHAAMRGTDMLLAEGMNIKVLLLPDGDDPDSFARKHSSEELRKYIDEQQTDFIAFKTRLTVEGQRDPVKRSEAIGGIVQSISVIPDQILRSTYITELSQRTGLKEQTLIAELNKRVRNNIEEKAKEREREERRTASFPTSPTPPTSPTTPTTPQDIPSDTNGYLPTAQGRAGVVAAASQVELLLLREIVRHGEVIIFNNVTTEDGGTISLTVAQYISYDLGQDGLYFSLPLYQQMLDEAVAHCSDPEFKAETYFCNHADQQVSQLASRLAIDRHQLGGRFVVQPREDALQQRVLHLVMDFRLDIIEQRMKTIQQQLRQAGSNMELMMQLMKEHKETKELRDMLAKRLGSDYTP